MPPPRSHDYELLRNKGKLGDEGSLTVLPRRCKSLVADHSRGAGQAKGQAPFYSAAPPDNLTANTRFYFFTPIRQSLNNHFLKGNSCLSSGQKSVRAVCGSSEAHFLPTKSARKFGPSKERDGPH
jgi:hypothetical protein